MVLNEKQIEMCTSSQWDFSDLRALFLVGVCPTHAVGGPDADHSVII